MRLSGTKTSTVSSSKGLGNQLYDLGGARPTLDLNFANNESLDDSITGKNLVTHTRASSATYVDGDGVIQSAVTNLLLQSEDFSTSWNADGVCTVATDQIASPVGTLTADKITVDAGGPNRVSQTSTLQVLAGNTYILSAYVKTLDINKIHFRLFITGSDSYVDYTFADNSFNVSNATFITQTGYTSLTDGWTRIYLRYEPTVSGNVNIRFGGGIGGDSTNGSFYIWGAQLEQSSTVGEYVKTTSTINSAPRFDHDPSTGESLGLLVEEARTNLLLQSEDFSTTWTTTDTTVSASQTTAPDGNTTADKILETATTAEHNVRQDTASQAAGTYTLSIFAKAAERTNLQFVSTGVLGGFRANFDLTNGVLGSVDAQLTASILPYPDGWYKCIVTATSTSTGTLRAQWNIVTSPTAARVESYAGDITKGLYLWGAQLEAGSFPTSYIPTDGATVTRAADIAEITGNDFGTFNLVEYSEEFDQSSWTTVNSEGQPNVIKSPDGTFTADKIIAQNGNNEHGVRQDFSVVIGNTYTFSCHLKAAERTEFELAFRVAGLWPGGANQIVNFTLTGAGSAAVTSGTPTSTIEAVGDGWYRCSITQTAAATGTSQVRVQDTFDADGEGIYVWGAQLEESSTVTPYVKSDVTWTSRASNATYYDKDGVIRKSSYNLLLRSEEFDQSPWINSGATITPNAGIAPNGTTTATRIQDVANDSLRVVAGATGQRKSIYARATSGSGTVAILGHAAVSQYVVTLTETWQRFDFPVDTTETGGTNIYAVDFRTGTLKDILIWGAQLETGTYAGDYAKTEGSAASTARTAAYLPDGNGNFISAGELLLEEARTNLLLYSACDSNWTTGGFGTATYDLGLSALGIFSGVSVGSLGQVWHTLIRTGISLTAATTYAFTLYYRAGTSGRCRLVFRNNTTTTETVIKGPAGSLSVSGEFAGSATILSQYLSLDGLTYVVTGTFTPNNTSADHWFRIGPDSATSGETVIALGAQLEEGSYATSYIPTSGSTATRAADVSSSSSNTFGNSWYNQSEGTVFCEGAVPVGVASTRALVSIDDGSSANRIQLRHNGTTARTQLVVDNGSVQFNCTVVADSFPPGEYRKLAMAMKANDFAAVVDSTGTVDQDSSGTMPTPTQMQVGLGPANVQPCKPIKRITYWPQRLSNATLQTITN